MAKTDLAACSLPELEGLAVFLTQSRDHFASEPRPEVADVFNAWLIEVVEVAEDGVRLLHAPMTVPEIGEIVEPEDGPIGPVGVGGDGAA